MLGYQQVNIITCSRAFSISMSLLTPSMTIWIWSTSDDPRRSRLEMSNVPSVDAVLAPPVDRKSTHITAYDYDMTMIPGVLEQ